MWIINYDDDDDDVAVAKEHEGEEAGEKENILSGCPLSSM